jgi:hypothetical protein
LGVLELQEFLHLGFAVDGYAQAKVHHVFVLDVDRLHRQVPRGCTLPDRGVRTILLKSYTTLLDKIFQRKHIVILVPDPGKGVCADRGCHF